MASTALPSTEADLAANADFANGFAALGAFIENDGTCYTADMAEDRYRMQVREEGQGRLVLFFLCRINAGRQ